MTQTLLLKGGRCRILLRPELQIPKTPCPVLVSLSFLWSMSLFPPLGNGSNHQYQKEVLLVRNLSKVYTEFLPRRC